MGHCERYATALLVQGCTSPPPASSFRFAGLLARVPVLAAYAHSPEPGYRGRRSCLQARTAGRIGAMHNGGCFGLESAVMHSPLSRMVTAQKPHRIAVLVGLRSLWSTDSVPQSYRLRAHLCNIAVARDKRWLS